MSLMTPSSPHHRTTTSPLPSPTTSSPRLEENLSNQLGITYPVEMSGAVCNRVVRFDSECVLIPELNKSRKPLMITKSYAIPLWKRRTIPGESEEMQVSPSSSPTMGGVVFKLPLPSFMAKAARSPSRTRECSRPPCLVNTDVSQAHSLNYTRQPRLSNPTSPPNVLPNPILVVDTHHQLHSNQSSALSISPSPSSSASSESGSNGGGPGSRSPINRSPTVSYTTPAGLSATTTADSPTLGPPPRERQGKDKDKDREREKEKDRIITIPLRACCPDCFPITEECVRNGDQWKERFSKGARRRRGSSVSSSEGGDDLGMFSPMASYKPLQEGQQEKNKVEDKSNPNSNPRDGLASNSSTSAVVDDDDTEEDVMSSLSLAVRVDEVDCMQGSTLGRLKRQPSLDPMDTEDDELSSNPHTRERDVSSSSVGSSFSTFSTMSGVSSATSNAGDGESFPLKSTSTCEPPAPLRGPNIQPLPSTSITPPSSYTKVTRGNRRQKPSTPIKEDEEPSEERCEGSSRDRERGRRRREHQRLKALKTHDLYANDDDLNMLFPLPSPRRSPSTSPLSA
ncbi:hypothetical protein E1B28_009632 [Marasmius oreades]|uniref:Uncharacterized protein n=1 Tax=Marasmius oreades TaxID=181124 RepID=A0A9P7RWX6_9AGAR|nr:uncharacterized protein E1B28_009632 [Marasmius oreades]KAG7090523.1 hypothetical protein E1B28_009632 [Marasmius oreades]